MADVDTKSMSAPQAASTDIAEGGENGRKSQTNPRIQCSSVETTNNHSSIQSEKAQSPDTFLSQCPAPGPSPEPSGTITLKMQTAVLPLCLGESTVFLPVHVQMPTPAPAVQVSALAATPPSVLSSHGLVSLPLILEQQIFQQFNSQFFPQGAACTAPPPPLLQSNTLCQNSSVTFCQPSPREQKVVEEAAVEQDRIPFVPSPGFTAVSQDQFTTCNSFAQITCQMAGPKSPQAFAQGFLPSPPSLPISYPYTSLLAPLVPPPTLLVPFPVVVPLPIPLPIPIPIRTKDEGHEPKSTVSVGTQTCEGFCVRSNSLTHATESEGGALDLSASTGLTRLKHEVLSPQDSPLDLSVAVAFPGCRSRVQVEQQDIKQPVRDVQKSEQSLEAFQPLGYGQTLDSELLSGLNSREFDRRHKCVMDNLCGHEPKYDARNYEIVSTSQTAKVLVDSIPTILSGKLKDFAGMPDNTFRCQQDTELGILVGHHCSASRNPQGEAGHLIDSRKGISRNRSVKFKKVSSQEIHILPIKKQRFTTFFHGE